MRVFGEYRRTPSRTVRKMFVLFWKLSTGFCQLKPTELKDARCNEPIGLRALDHLRHGLASSRSRT